uniref:Uncharacterized protein n=1 Tax=Cacopsylla melanoneura TaxID=428564 RepID=A0A8D8TFN7_9HEMI
MQVMHTFLKLRITRTMAQIMMTHLVMMMKKGLVLLLKSGPNLESTMNLQNLLKNLPTILQTFRLQALSLTCIGLLTTRHHSQLITQPIMTLIILHVKVPIIIRAQALLNLLVILIMILLLIEAMLPIQRKKIQNQTEWLK